VCGSTVTQFISLLCLLPPLPALCSVPFSPPLPKVLTPSPTHNAYSLPRHPCPHSAWSLPYPQCLLPSSTPLPTQCLVPPSTLSVGADGQVSYPPRPSVFARASLGSSPSPSQKWQPDIARIASGQVWCWGRPDVHYLCSIHQTVKEHM